MFANSYKLYIQNFDGFNFDYLVKIHQKYQIFPHQNLANPAIVVIY